MTEPEQLSFEDVCEYEHVAGDQAYNEWLAAGRPKLEYRKQPEPRTDVARSLRT